VTPIEDQILEVLSAGQNTLQDRWAAAERFRIAVGNAIWLAARPPIRAGLELHASEEIIP
jgi:hypothetical protein